MNRACIALAVGFLLIGSRVSAQTTCNESNHHWRFGSIYDAADSVTLGMVHWFGVWIPAVCEGDVVYPEPYGYAYSSRQLSTSTSLCLGGGNDSLTVLGYTQTESCNGETIYGFSDNGHELSVSGEAGDDFIYLASYEGATNLWGGDHDDHLYCGTGDDYANGGKGHDYIKSAAGDDDMRGHTGSDLLDHSNIYGVDYVLGELGNDCSYVFHTAVAGSSCSGGADMYNAYADPLTSCETQVADCFESSGPFVY